LSRAVERASRTPGAAAPPVTHDVARTATTPPVPATAEAGAARPAPLAAFTHSRPPPADRDAVRRDYLAALAEAIDRNKYYPRKSRRRAEQGRVTVAFVIAADGAISDVAVASSSGYRRLDAAARDAVRSLRRFEPIPEALARDRWPIRVPLDFRLR
ncbi:MAG: energy transducer TonB, partial [Gammaproteobacteria bacterium]|nr:energy transducer TonB [Gammaproteobacteria bacterium]